MSVRDAGILHRRLDLLALNQMQIGQQGPISKPVAAHWMVHVQHHRPPANAAISPRQLARAATWWNLAGSVGLLRVRETTVSFEDAAEVAYFSLHFCQTRPLDARLLRLTARQPFAPVWREWASQDPSVLDRVVTLLHGAAEPRTQARAATVLGHTGDSRAITPLMEALNDPCDAVRIAATGAAAVFGDPDIAARLARMIVDAPNPLRPPLAVALGHGGGDPAVSALVELLEHPDWRVQHAALEGLGWTGSARAVAPLMSYIAARRTADWNAFTPHVYNALLRLGEIAVPALTAALDDERAGFSRHAERILNIRKRMSTTPALKREQSRLHG